MATYTVTICDGCGVHVSPTTARVRVRVSVSDKSAEVCSLECAQRWMAAMWEDAVVPHWNLYSEQEEA